MKNSKKPKSYAKGGMIEKEGMKPKKKTAMDGLKDLGKYISTFGFATEGYNPADERYPKKKNEVKRKTAAEEAAKTEYKSGGAIKKENMKKTAKKKMTADMKAVAKHEKIEKKMEKEGYMKSGGKLKKK